MEIERNNFREDIECAGDTITYNCSILSNSEDVVLMWFVTIPGMETLNVTYDKTSVFDIVNYLANNITTIITDFVDGDYIESSIILTVLDSPNMNGTLVECASLDLDSEPIVVSINKSGTRD
jgi:hypothetical protein